MNIYVGNLSFKLNDMELRRIFEEYGEVLSVKIITDKYTGRSKGFAFIEMSNDREGQIAINELDGKELHGRQIVVNVARERKSNRY